MNNFFTQYLKEATEKDVNARWSGMKNGVYFRCAFCGYKFGIGDFYRIVYTNDIVGASGNPIVCEKCNDTDEILIERWKQKHILARTEFWWFTKSNYE